MGRAECHLRILWHKGPQQCLELGLPVRSACPIQNGGLRRSETGGTARKRDAGYLGQHLALFSPFRIIAEHAFQIAVKKAVWWRDCDDVAGPAYG